MDIEKNALYYNIVEQKIPKQGWINSPNHKLSWLLL